MVRRQCVCGGPLHGLHHRGAHMFGFVPSSSLAHYNYDCEFDTGITLPGGRVLEQCERCGAMVLCEYPTLDGSLRGDDPLITYGPGTVYEQCDLSQVPLTYRSFRALMSSGVTGGVMYSGAFRDRIAQLFHTDPQRLPSWKVVKDALFDISNSALDEWWFASIGRNFIVLYESSQVLHLVSAWHRVPGTEIRNPRIVHINSLNTDPLRHQASDTVEMSAASQELVIPEERKRILAIGNQARLRLIDSSIQIGRTLPDMAQWAPVDAMERGSALAKDGAVETLVDTSFGIRHARVRDGDAVHSVDLLMRHDVVAKVTCTCDEAQGLHVCAHIVAMVFELGRRYSFLITMPAKEPAGALAVHGTDKDGVDVARYGHYADAAAIMREPHRARYSWITPYVEPFADPPEPLYHVEFMASPVIGMPNVGYCVYTEVVLSFIDLVIQQGDADYARVLHRYGLDKEVVPSILTIETLDAPLVMALVTMVVYRERRNEGYLAECLENGVLVRMLKRLREADGEAGDAD
ncbi:MAG: DUF6508 domain-containing protein [Bifidobacterium sp.]|nr:DUF6508 domain-containing protein [Bifidobacterium sp.]